MCLEPCEEVAIAEDPVFEHFGKACAQFAFGQGRKRIEIGQHQRWLVKCADQVLARSGIDCGFPPHRAVDLREQGGRELDESATALENGAGKAGEIADHAAAESEDMIAPFDALAEQPIGEMCEALPAFGGFSRRDIVPSRLDTFGLQ